MGIAWARGKLLVAIAADHGMSKAQAWRELKKIGMCKLRKNRPGIAKAMCDAYKNGESSSRIAQRFGATKQSVLELLKAHGIDTAKNRCALKLLAPQPPADGEVLGSYSAGMTCAAVAKKYGVSEGYVWRRVEKAGISRRAAVKKALGWNCSTTRTEKNRFYDNRRRSTPEGKIKRMARNQLVRIKRHALGFVKGARTHEYLGCTYAEAVAHIEKQLKPGWTWENHGKVWHIDHIVQLSDGPLSSDFHVRAVCHYSNLRPLGAFENMSRKSGPWINTPDAMGF